jgi:hypothetical protein
VQQVLAVELDAAAGMAGQRIGQEPQDRQRGDRFAGPRFADQAKVSPLSMAKLTRSTTVFSPKATLRSSMSSRAVTSRSSGD